MKIIFKRKHSFYSPVDSLCLVSNNPTIKEILWMANYWAPKKAKSFSILEVRFEKITKNDRWSNFKNRKIVFEVCYFTTKKEGQTEIIKVGSGLIKKNN